MYRLRNSGTLALIMLLALINAVVLIINPGQPVSICFNCSATTSFCQTEDEITSSDKRNSLNSLQYPPQRESGLSNLSGSPLQLSLPVIYFKEDRIQVHECIPKYGQSYLPEGCQAETNDPELFLLHRRLNT